MQDCTDFDMCKNNTKCLRCRNKSLFKPKYGNVKKDSRMKPSKSNTKSKYWETLEQHTADALNDVPSITSARRARRSGAMWFEKGDVVDDIVFPECKAREGRTLIDGDKSLNIRKSWVVKAKEEALATGKPMLFIAAFNEDPPDEVMALMRLTDMSQLITHHKALISELAAKDKQIEKLLQQLAEKEND